MSLFKGCGSAFLDSLSVLLREAHFASEEVIFQQNDVSKELSYIVSGVVNRLIDVSAH
jgi:CRP-like cAMP-binding protein